MNEPQRDDLSPANRSDQTSEPTPALRFEMSPSIGKLIGALAKARKQFTPIIKANENPFFKSKYADLADVIEATKEGLSANGLAVLQFLGWESISGVTVVTTLLAHESGEWIRGILGLPTMKRDAQAIGSSSTYGRRYSYSAVLNVASEQDDDGSGAVSKPFEKKAIAEHERAFEEREAKQPPVAPIVSRPKRAEGVVVLNDIQELKDKKGKTYWRMDVIDVNGNSSLVSVWDSKLRIPELWQARGKDLLITVEGKDIAGKMYYNLKSIQQIGSEVLKPSAELEEIPMFDGE